MPSQKRDDPIESQELPLWKRPKRNIKAQLAARYAKQESPGYWRSAPKRLTKKAREKKRARMTMTDKQRRAPR